MATDWAADVKKYAANADDAIIGGIVRYCGIALRKVDSSLVAFSDPKELDRVRNNFLKKKLARTDADSVLDAAIAKVGAAMKADRTKNRVTVYYLLADHFKSLALFAPKAKAAAKTPAKKAVGAGAAALATGAAAASAKKPAAKKAAAPAKATTAKKATTKKAVTPAKAATAVAVAGGALGLASAAPAAAKDAAVKAADAVADTAKAATGAAVGAGVAAVGAVGAAAAGAAALASGGANAAASAVTGGAKALSGSTGDDDSGLGWLWWLLGLALLLFLAWWLFLRGPSDAAATGADTSAAASDAAAVSTDLAVAPTEGAVAIPTGAGVTTEMRDGKPVAKVYFDVGKIAVAPAFDGTAGGLKQWLADHPGSTLAISGYADPSGNAARNEQLAKQRAQAVQAALIKAGIPEASAVMVKPDSATDATVAKDAARRVEVVVK